MEDIQGFRAKLAIHDAIPAVAGERFDFLNENFGINEEMRDRNGMRGTRSHSLAGMRGGLIRVDGPLSMQPNAGEWAKLLPWILGGTPAGTSYTLAETLPEKFVTIARDDGTDGLVHTYTGTKVSRATIRSSQGNALELALDLMGKTEQTPGAAGSFPAIALDELTGPFVFSDLTLTVAGVTYQARDIEIGIDNALDGERFFNSRTRTKLSEQDRVVTVRISTPFGGAESLYTPPGGTGVAVVATFVNADVPTVSLVFSFVKVQFPRRNPAVTGRTEVFLPLEGTAYESGGTKELVVTLDSTV
jgi:hypothetical protein